MDNFITSANVMNGPLIAIIVLMAAAVVIGKAFKTRPIKAFVMGFIAILFIAGALLSLFREEMRHILITEAGLDPNHVQLQYYQISAIFAAGFGLVCVFFAYGAKRGDYLKAKKAERKAARKAAKE